MVLRVAILLHIKNLILRSLIAMKVQVTVKMMKSKITMTMMTMTTTMMMILAQNHLQGIQQKSLKCSLNTQNMLKDKNEIDVQHLHCILDRKTKIKVILLKRVQLKIKNIQLFVDIQRSISKNQLSRKISHIKQYSQIC